MRCRMMLINVALCLAMIVRQTIQVQQLNTGYIHAVRDVGNGRQSDLKCAFWYSGKIHLQMTKLLLQSDGLVPWTLKAISDFERNTERYLAVLYHLRSERIGALWLVHLYVGKAKSYSRYLSNDLFYVDNYVIKKMTVVQDYIIEKLEYETINHCTKANFDWTKNQFDDVRLTPNEVKAVIKQNTQGMKDMLKSNNLTAYVNITDFKVRNMLLLHDGVWVSLKKVIFNDFNRFNINTGWNDTIHLFKLELSNTHDLDFASNKLKPLRSYVSMVLDILKVIVMRMSLKYLTFLKQATSAHRRTHAVNWRMELRSFANIISTDTDEHIEYLIEAFGNELIPNDDFIEQLIKYIENNLKTLSSSLNCDAARQFTPLVEDIPNYNPKNPDHIDKVMKDEILVKANDFNKYIQTNIIKHDFGITWALFKYIDEPKWF